MSRVQVIAGVQRRRRFTLEEKRQVVAEITRPGASLSAVARRHEIAPSLLYVWKKSLAEKQALAPAVVAKVASETPFVRVISSPTQSIPSEPIRVRVGSEILVEFPLTMGVTQLASFISALRS